MKISMMLFGVLTLICSNAFSFQEGDYECTNDSGKIKFEYKITEITQGSVNMPYLEIVKTIYGDTGIADQVFVLKGIANEQINNSGLETLILEAASVALKSNGTPACS